MCFAISIIDLWFAHLLKMNYKRVPQSFLGAQAHDLLVVTCCLLSWNWKKKKKKNIYDFLRNSDRIHNAIFIVGAQVTAIRLRTIYQMIWCVKFTWAPTHTKKPNEFSLSFSTKCVLLWERTEQRERKSYGCVLRAWFC